MTSEKTKILSVTELTSEIRFNLSNQFSEVYVAGEISGLTRPSSGHVYFTLKDQTAQISGIIWRNDVERLKRQKFELENGLEFICGGSLDVYPQRGTYQLVVRSVQPVGAGPLELAFRQLHAKLELAGLFDPHHKKPLPKFPRQVVLITSPSGAAVRDFLQVLDRRWKNVAVLIIPVKVQGAGSAEEIAEAIRSVGRFAEPPDVVVITRGGGSIEDLWSFNEEIVCRAMFECPIPIVSGVGHEIDVTLADLVADVRALTPSEAAERLVPDHQALLGELTELQHRLRNSVRLRYRVAAQELERIANLSVLTRPLNRLQQELMELDRIDERLRRSMKQQIADRHFQIREWSGRLDALNPLSVLARGYSLTSDATGVILTDFASIQVGDTISTRLAQGSFDSRVERKSL